MIIVQKALEVQQLEQIEQLLLLMQIQEFLLQKQYPLLKDFEQLN